MKRLKQFFAMTLAVMLLLVLAVPAAAAGETFTLTINQTSSGHIYEVYQVFSGDLHEEGKNVILSNIQWGSSVLAENVEELLEVLKKEVPFDGMTENTAAAVAEVLSASEVAVAERFAEIVGQHLGEPVGTATYNKNAENYSLNNLSPGYYLVKDKDNSQDGTSSYYTQYILQVVKSVAVDPKGSAVTVEKAISDAINGTYDDYEDFNIGDTAYYQWTGTLPENLEDYDTYYYQFQDTLPTGLTFQRVEQILITAANGSVVQTVLNLNDTDTNNDTLPSGVTITEPAEDNKLIVTFENLKAVYLSLKKDHKVVVKYSCLLNEDAPVATAMTNFAELIFSNNPNNTGDGNPGTGDKPGGDTGKTVTDYAHAFTFEVGADKYDSADETKKLQGVVFNLYREENGTKNFAMADNQNDDGPYIISGWTDTQDEAVALTTDENGQINVRGLEAGVYYLTEIEAKPGYNLLEEDIKVEIKATYSGTETNTATVSVEYLVDGKSQEQNPFVSVPNAMGSVLPSTGGIGTTVFYIAGGVLVLGAVVLLVTRKRMYS